MLPEHHVGSIRDRLELGFERNLFEAALIQIKRVDDPLRVNNFAYALRELSRHVLKRLAPDEDIKDAPWHVEFIDDRAKVIITRSQRMKFVVQGDLTDDFLKNELEINYDVEAKDLGVAIDKLSKFTHVNSDTFGVSEKIADSLCDEALSAMSELLQSAIDCRSRTLHALSEYVDVAVLETVVEETLEGFYEFATHYIVDEVHVEGLEFTGFNGDEIYGDVEGVVSVTLQYGSDGDMKRGDGLQMEESTGFTCQVVVSSRDLASISVSEDSLKVDFDSLRESWGDSEDDSDHMSY